METPLIITLNLLLMLLHAHAVSTTTPHYFVPLDTSQTTTLRVFCFSDPSHEVSFLPDSKCSSSCGYYDNQNSCCKVFQQGETIKCFLSSKKDYYLKVKSLMFDTPCITPQENIQIISDEENSVLTCLEDTKHTQISHSSDSGFYLKYAYLYEGKARKFGTFSTLKSVHLPANQETIQCNQTNYKWVGDNNSYKLARLRLCNGVLIIIIILLLVLLVLVTAFLVKRCKRGDTQRRVHVVGQLENMPPLNNLLSTSFNFLDSIKEVDTDSASGSTLERTLARSPSNINASVTDEGSLKSSNTLLPQCVDLTCPHNAANSPGISDDPAINIAPANNTAYNPFNPASNHQKRLTSTPNLGSSSRGIYPALESPKASFSKQFNEAPVSATSSQEYLLEDYCYQERSEGDFTRDVKYSYTIQIEESVRARCSSLNACTNNRLETNKDNNGGDLPSGFEMVDGDDGVDCEPLTNAWVPDDGVINCMVCMTTKFGGLKRKHHCRRCGKVCCSSCLTKTLLDQGTEAVRVCGPCLAVRGRANTVA